MARKTKKEDTPLERLLELIDEKVQARGQSVIAELDATEEITKLASEARRKGATMSELTQHVKRMDRSDRTLKPVTRQAIDMMIAVHEQRRPARTTRASRRRREEPVGRINAEALK
jgi:hypothetical protein